MTYEPGRTSLRKVEPETNDCPQRKRIEKGFVALACTGLNQNLPQATKVKVMTGALPCAHAWKCFEAKARPTTDQSRFLANAQQDGAFR